MFCSKTIIVVNFEAIVCVPDSGLDMQERKLAARANGCAER